ASLATRRLRRRWRTTIGCSGSGRNAAFSSRSKRSMGRSWVVPCTRASAVVSHAREVLLELCERGERPVCEAVALHVFHAALGLPLRARSIGTTRSREHTPVAAERKVRGMKVHGACLAVAAEHESLRIVAKQRARN